jgi:pimeloyl-ACP methyl ester carboxylesterase
MTTDTTTREVLIPLKNGSLPGILQVPEQTIGLIIFSHGSGSSRMSPRNNYVARLMHTRNMATLLFDLLTEREDLQINNRFDIELLTQRLLIATNWIRDYLSEPRLPIGYFGASTGAASALKAAAYYREKIAAVVSRGGRPDLAFSALPQVTAPTLLIVGGLDSQVLALNRRALRELNPKSKLELVSEATHLFSEPGKLEQAARLSAKWFETHFTESPYEL